MKRQGFQYPDWPRWMDVKTAAAYTCMSPSKIRELIADGLLKTTRIIGLNGRPGHPRIDRRDLDRLLETFKQEV